MAVSVIGEGNWSTQRKLPHGLIGYMISNATISYIVYFSYIMAVSVIGEGNWSTQRKLPHGLIGYGYDI